VRGKNTISTIDMYNYSMYG